MTETIPILRIFNYDKMKEFYIDWLGFTIDWEHNPENAPIYLGVSLGQVKLHLSEHHGDGTPGTKVFIENFPNLKSYHRELQNKSYKYMNPGIGKFPFMKSTLCMEVVDPFGNKIVFTGPKK